MSLINKALSELNDTPPDEPDKNQQAQFINTSIFASKNTKQNSTIIAAICIALLLTSTTLTIILIKKHQQIISSRVSLTRHQPTTTQHNLSNNATRLQNITATTNKILAQAPLQSTDKARQVTNNFPINKKASTPTKKATLQLQSTDKTKQVSPIKRIDKKTSPAVAQINSTSLHQPPTSSQATARNTTPPQSTHHIKKVAVALKINNKPQAITLIHKPGKVTAPSNNLAQLPAIEEQNPSTNTTTLTKPRLEKQIIINEQAIPNKIMASKLTINNANKIASSIAKNKIEIAPTEKMQDTIQANTSHASLHLYKKLIQKIKNNPSIDISAELSNPSLQQQLTTHQMSLIASQLIENNQIKQANEFLAMDIETHSESIALSQLYAKTLFLNNQYVQALAILSNLSPAFYNHPDYYSLMASIYLKLHQTLLASQIYQHLVQIQPNTFQYWLGLAIANQRLSNTDIAIDAYQHTLSLTPIDGNIAKFSRQQLYRLQKNI